MSEYYQENNDEKDSQSSQINNDKTAFYVLIVFLFIAFIFGCLIVGGGYLLFKYIDNQEKLIKTEKIYQVLRVNSAQK